MRITNDGSPRQPIMHAPRPLILVGILLAHAVAAGPKPIEFEFVAPDSVKAQNPYSRELWAEIITPGGQTLTLPAYYADGGLYAVRARPDEVGAYHFGKVSETTLGVHQADMIVSLVTPAEIENPSRTRHPAHPEGDEATHALRRHSLRPGGRKPCLGAGRQGRPAQLLPPGPACVRPCQSQLDAGLDGAQIGRAHV